MLEADDPVARQTTELFQPDASRLSLSPRVVDDTRLEETARTRQSVEQLEPMTPISQMKIPQRLVSVNSTPPEAFANPVAVRAVKVRVSQKPDQSLISSQDNIVFNPARSDKSSSIDARRPIFSAYETNWQRSGQLATRAELHTNIPLKQVSFKPELMD